MKKLTRILIVVGIFVIMFAACGGEEEEVVKPEPTYPHGCEIYAPVYLVESTLDWDVFEVELDGNYMIHYLEPQGDPLVAYAGDVVRLRTTGSIYMWTTDAGREYWGNPDFHMFMKYGASIPQWIGRFNEVVIISFPFEISREIALYILEAPMWFLCADEVEGWYANNRSFYTVEITVQHYPDPEETG